MFAALFVSYYYMKTIYCIVLLLGSTLLAFAQQTYTISGTISDAQSGEVLIGATIIDSTYQYATSSNSYGFYSLSLPRLRKAKLQISYVGYQPDSIVLAHKPKSDTIINVRLQPQPLLQPVTVMANGAKNISGASQMSHLHIPMRQIKEVPMLGGESDVLKVYATMPGVSTGTESTVGMLVRGGSSDQNLILLDDAVVYNVAHINGFISVFNSQAIQNATLLKGGFPARYGGRLSSVMAITMKEGNKEHLSGEFAIGTASSRALIEGPLLHKKASFMLSGRLGSMALLRLPQRLAFNAGKRDSYYSLGFYDINAKVNYQISDSKRLYLSFYQGFDNRIDEHQRSNIDYDSNELRWGNITATARYTQVLNPKLFSKAILAFTQYHYQVNREGYHNAYLPDTVLATYKRQNASTIQDVSAKYALDYVPNNRHYMRAGVELTHHRYMPTILKGSIGNYENGLQTDSTFSNGSYMNGLEGAIYAEDEWQIGKRLTITGGLRYTNFVVQGNYYHALEPRMNMNIRLYKNAALQFSYGFMQQYIHALTNYALDYPNDIFVPATARVAPPKSHQWTLGITQHLPKSQIVLGVEAYYKTMSDLITYKEGSDDLFTYNSNWQDLLATKGKGESWGVEFLAQRQVGRINGWVAYTWSVNNRQFETINNGNVFPFRYDRRHQLNIVLNAQLGKHISLTALWSYQTGHAITLPVAEYSIEGLGGAMVFSDRNNYRMPDYHRADINLNYTVVSKRNGSSNVFTIGCYNVYNRANPHSLFIRISSVKNSVYQTSLLPLLPYIQFSKKFK